MTRLRHSRAGVLIAIAAIALLYITAADAATVQKDGDVATGITGLTIGSLTYDVVFEFDTAAELYPFQTFDFDSIAGAEAGVQAIIAALNEEGGVLGVGESAAEGSETFSIPYDSFTRIFDPPGHLLEPVDITFLLVSEGMTGDPNQAGVWVDGGLLDGSTLLTGSTYAKFTLVDSGGPGNQAPTADANGPYQGQVGKPVAFDGSGSDDPDGTIVDYDWRFGDVGTGDGESPIFTFEQKGVYNITLGVTDGQGASDSDSTVATIGFNSVPPNAEPGGPYVGSVGNAISFDGSASGDPDGNIVTWRWEFGDGRQGSGPTPKHTYDESGFNIVTLTVTDDSGETDVDTTSVTIGDGNLSPLADAGGPYIGAAGVAKQFDGSGSADLDGNIVTWEWDFGDGEVGTGEMPRHTYQTAGSYTAILKVTDDDGAESSDNASVVIGEPNPRPDNRRIDLVTFGDVGRSPAADLAVLNVVLANGDVLNQTLHVHDGGTGNEIYDVVLSGEWNSLAIEQATANAGQRLAILQTDSGGNIRVRLLNADDGTEALTVSYFDDTWTPIDILNVRDAGGPGIEGIGVLAENRDGQQAIEVRTAGGGALVNQVLYFNDVWKASYAVDLGEFNGNGRSELSVVATNNAGKHAVETRDALSGKQISRYFFLGPTNTMKGLAQSADVDGNGRPEVIVLGNKEADNNTANTAQAKDVKTDALISKPGTLAPPFVGFALRSMEDVDGNGSPEMVIGAFDDQGNVTRVQSRDVLNGTLTLNTGMLSAAFDPRDLEILEDVSGNGIQEFAAAGVDRETLAIRVQTRDGQSGVLLLNIDIN